MLGSTIALMTSNCFCTRRSSFRMELISLLDVFRMGTSFSALILASKSSHARPVFWKRILGEEQGQGQ